jgi:aspartyl-tRNA(Asn)/glutamyl-tRNA(Gln) amidotransferase subunit C
MKDEIRDIAENARIKLDKSELEGLVKDFDEVLEMFDTLDEIDTEDVDPSFHPSETKSRTRKDKVEETVENPFENTENTEEGFFKGPSA